MSLQTILDKSAIGLSLMCVVHCLVLPLVLVAFPTGMASALGGESFHKMLLLLVLPTSILAFVLGCKKHKKKMVFSFAVLGLTLLLLPLVLGHEVVGELGEKLLTTVGGVNLAVAHLLNFRLCRGNEKEGCCAKESGEILARDYSL